MNIVAVTIKQIADICGVSRGTVDRVINERGKVKPETEKLVRETAARLGYQPNLAGRALAARKRAFTIGVVLTSEGNAFFDDVLKGIARAEKEIADYGARVILKTMRGYSSARQIELISELAEEADAVILNPVNDQHIKKRIDDLTEKGKYVITVNTDIQNSKRLCYIGSHYQKGGETACGMLGLCGNRDRGRFRKSARARSACPGIFKNSSNAVSGIPGSRYRSNGRRRNPGV